jgi:hypothetical protein
VKSSDAEATRAATQPSKRDPFSRDNEYTLLRTDAFISPSLASVDALSTEFEAEAEAYKCGT